MLHVLLYTIFARLGLPRLLDELGQTDVVGVELVDAVRGAERADAEEPAAEGAEGSKLALVHVVVDTGLEADVRVGQDREAENAVEDGLGLAQRSGGGRGDGGREGGQRDGMPVWQAAAISHKPSSRPLRALT